MGPLSKKLAFNIPNISLVNEIIGKCLLINKKRKSHPYS